MLFGIIGARFNLKALTEKSKLVEADREVEE